MNEALEAVYEDIVSEMFQVGKDTSLLSMIIQFELEIEYLEELYAEEEIGTYDTYKKLIAARLELARLVSLQK